MSYHSTNYYPVWPHAPPSYVHTSPSYYSAQPSVSTMGSYPTPHAESLAQYQYRSGQTPARPAPARAATSIPLNPPTGANIHVDRLTTRTGGPSRPLGNLRPSDVDCRWWKKGYCARGAACFFKHDPSRAGADVQRRANVHRWSDRESATPPQSNQEGNDETRDDADPKDTPLPIESSTHSTSEEECSICKEMPQTYGLLVNCYHCFCLECIRIWRASGNKKALDHDSRNGESCNWKQCPICRKYSDYVIPSSIFPTPVYAKGLPANPAKEELIKGYLAKLKDIPCRYFEDSIKRQYHALETSAGSAVKSRNRSGRRGHSSNRSMDEAILSQVRPHCRFGNDCHYAHLDPRTKQAFVFSVANVQQLRAERDRVVRETAEQRRIWVTRQARAEEARDEIISRLEFLMNAGLERARQEQAEPAC